MINQLMNLPNLNLYICPTFLQSSSFVAINGFLVRISYPQFLLFWKFFFFNSVVSEVILTILSSKLWNEIIAKWHLFLNNHELYSKKSLGFLTHYLTLSLRLEMPVLQNEFFDLKLTPLFLARLQIACIYLFEIFVLLYTS